MIVLSLRAKIESSRWQDDFSRQRQQYWWQGFLRQRLMEGKPRELDALLREGIIVATHSLSDRAIIHWPHPPYPSFAVTGPPCPQ
jgi:hypothetical protein